LRFASGSLAQFLDVRYSAKVPSSSTLDDVQGTLEKFIPEAYNRTESEFLARVEEDAVSFRPHGEKIASYTRVAPNNATKGKGATVTLPEDDPDAIVYEVWHVRASNPEFSFPCTLLTCPRQLGRLQDFENIIGGCNSSFYSTSRPVLTSMRRKNRGSLPFCESLQSSLAFLQRVLMRIDTKSGNGERHQSQRRIILWGTPRYIPSIAFRTRSASD